MNCCVERGGEGSEGACCACTRARCTNNPTAVALGTNALRARRTALAVAGEDYCVVAADTRMSSGFNILCREKGKCSQL